MTNTLFPINLTVGTIVLFFAAIIQPSYSGPNPPTVAEIFVPKTIDELQNAYQVAIVDINHDGRMDIAALGEGKNSGVYWYENPSWKKHPISSSATSEHINMDFYDLDQDGEL